VALERIDLSEEHIATIIRVKIIGEIGTTLAVTSNLSTLPSNESVLRFLVTANVVPSSPILFLQEPHGVTSQKTASFIVTAVKTLNLHSINRLGSIVET
jgi:hypothetical protein